MSDIKRQRLRRSGVPEEITEKVENEELKIMEDVYFIRPKLKRGMKLGYATYEVNRSSFIYKIIKLLISNKDKVDNQLCEDLDNYFTDL
jgi:hypothetical protein